MEENTENKPKRRNRTGITKAIIENTKLPNPLSYVELAAALRARPETIYRTAARLRAEGRIPLGRGVTPAPPGWKSAEPTDSPPEPVTAPRSILDTPPSEWDEDALAAIDKLPVLNSDQRKKLLSAIAMRPSAGVGQAAALKTLEDIDKGAGTQIGPPPPLTEVQTIERLSRLMRAVGQVLTQKSMEAAFESGNSSETPPLDQREPLSSGESDMA